MRLVDSLGNTLRPGDLLRWHRTGLVVRVTAIEPGGVELPDGRKSPGMLRLEVPLPFDPDKGPVVQFTEFDRVVDPASEAIVESILDRPRKEDGDGKPRSVPLARRL